MNFIFDIGNVLISFKPVSFLSGLFPEEQTIHKLNELIFLGPEWVQLDLGVLDVKEAFDIFSASEPGLQAEINIVLQNIDCLFVPMSETIKLLPEIRNAGHNLYYLSNLPLMFRDSFLKEYRFFDLFDGGVFSCEIHVTKPSPGIYRRLLTKYSLTPGECVFVDDVVENVAAAINEGINSVLFTGIDSVTKLYLK